MSSPTPFTGSPSAAELVAAVAEFLDNDVRAVGGQVGFHARVASNVLRIVERELLSGAGAPARAALDKLGFTDEASLARAIRDGRLDDRDDEVLSALRAVVRHRLSIDHPGYGDPS